MSRARPIALLVALALTGCDRGGKPAAPVVATPLARPPTPPPPPAAPESPLRVVRAVGTVERQGSDGWVSAQNGEALADDAVLRSGEGSEAVIQVADGVRVTLSPQGEIQIRKPEGADGRVTLRAGHAFGEVEDGKRASLTVGVKDSVALVRTQAGKLSVQRGESGVVAAASLKGEAQVEAGGEVVTLAEGQLSRVRDDKASAPAPIPASLLLKVNFPKPEGTIHRPTIRVTGRTSDGTARVLVNGQPVVVGEGGEFSADVSLSTGSNQVRISAKDVGGNEKEWSSAAFTADPTRPKISQGHEDPWR